MAQDIPAGEAMNETQERGYQGNDTTRSEGGVLGQHQEQKPGMAEKMKKTLSSMKVRVGGGHQYSTAPHSPRDNASPDGGRVGDAVAPTNTGGVSRAYREGNPASPKPPHKDLGEKIMDMLPGTHVNPYSTGYPTRPEGATPYVAGAESTAAPTSPTGQQTSPTASGGFLGKLKNMMTGQKPAQGVATDNVTRESTSLMSSDGYSQSPSPRKSGDLFDRTKGKIGLGGRKGGAADIVPEGGWPSPAKPDYHNMPGATYTDEKGHPIEGPTQPVSEDTKKEGLMTKVMDKIHPHEKTGTSPTAATTGTNTVPTENAPNTTTPTTNPTPTESDYHSKPGATYTDEGGNPIEGPTQSLAEDTKKEGLMTKIMDKIHPPQKSSTSPTAATTGRTEATAA